ncbi:SSU ribosomal protein S30P /sigma 54 modulation protein [Alteribacillus persepolensis]|uniref:Ribosome hibernation promoting factor n=1 Tax=Alteribacillus persepolensis TaxID=568899 RepID=A0A1G8AGZ8_9BACI|nr:ribosome-associated translation inhibitor RaiA [Alteribacillus persepolensis]SDH20171.1 SSU ribosomal protein S30P /sigma 54 modulation protein [Alteribacillus persepolensis]
MEYNIRGENLEVTPALKNYVEKKVGKLERYFDTTPSADVHVKMQVHNSEHIIEVTVPMSQLLLRAEETHTDMYAAIDLVVEKLERQIRKHKTKVNRKLRQNGSVKYMFKDNIEDLNEEIVNGELKNGEFPGDDIDDYEIVRTKRFNLKPMDTEEAILQMDMLGHNFFVFSNAVNGDTNVVYRRKDGRYGLIEPES